MGAILGLVLPFIPGAISLVEKLFGQGKGSDKSSTVVSWIAAIIQDLQKAGVSGTVPTLAQIEAVVETVFQQMNAAGQVNTTNPTPVKGGDFIITIKNGLMQSVG